MSAPPWMNLIAKTTINYSQHLVNSERFSNFRCFMHKTLECRQSGPGKTKIILLCILCVWIKWLCLCCASSDSSPSMSSVSAWLPVCDVLRMTVRLVSSPSGLGDQIPRLDPSTFFLLHLVHVGWFTLFIAGWSVRRWRVWGMECVLEHVRLPQSMWEAVQRVHIELSGLSVCIQAEVSPRSILMTPPCSVCVVLWFSCGVCSGALVGPSHVTGSLPRLATFRLIWHTVDRVSPLVYFPSVRLYIYMSVRVCVSLRPGGGVNYKQSSLVDFLPSIKALSSIKSMLPPPTSAYWKHYCIVNLDMMKVLLKTLLCFAGFFLTSLLNEAFGKYLYLKAVLYHGFSLPMKWPWTQHSYHF